MAWLSKALGGRTDAGVFRAVPSQLGPGPSWRTALFALDLETGLSRAEVSAYAMAAAL